MGYTPRGVYSSTFLHFLSWRKRLLINKLLFLVYGGEIPKSSTIFCLFFLYEIDILFQQNLFGFLFLISAKIVKEIMSLGYRFCSFFFTLFMDLRIKRYRVTVNCMKVLDHSWFYVVKLCWFFCIPRLYLLFMNFYAGSVINISSHFILFNASKLYSRLPVNWKGVKLCILKLFNIFSLC